MGTGQVSCAVVHWDRWSEVVKGFDIHDCMWVRGCGGAAPEIACFNLSLDMTPLPAVLKLFQWMPRFFLLLLATHPFFQQHFLKVRRLQARYDDILVFLKLSVTTGFCLCSSWTVTRQNYSSSPKSGVGCNHALSWCSKHPHLRSHVGIFKQRQPKLWEGGWESAFCSWTPYMHSVSVHSTNRWARHDFTLDMISIIGT